MPRFRIGIDNRTHWSTAGIKSLVRACAKLRGLTDLPIWVRVCYSRPKYTHEHSKPSAWIGGYAYFDPVRDPKDRSGLFRRWIQLNLPGPKRIADVGPESALPLRTLAQVVLHELDHTCGRKRHKDMVHWWEMDTADVEVGITIPWAPPAPKPKIGRSAALQQTVQKRARKAQLNLKRAEQALEEAEHAKQLAKDRVRRWRTKVRYYEKKGIV